MTGSQQKMAFGFAALTRATMSSSTQPVSEAPRYPLKTASQSPRTPRSAMPSNKVSIVSAGTTAPRHRPWPVWFENTTVSSDQTSQPRRCSGNIAAALPTCPYATRDCTDRTVGIRRAASRVAVEPVEDALQAHEHDEAARAEETDPGVMQAARPPRRGEEEAGEPDHDEQRDHDREVAHRVHEQRLPPALLAPVEMRLDAMEREAERADEEDEAARVVAGPGIGAGEPRAEHRQEAQHDHLYPKPEPRTHVRFGILVRHRTRLFAPRRSRLTDKRNYNPRGCIAEDFRCPRPYGPAAASCSCPV